MKDKDKIFSKELEEKCMENAWAMVMREDRDEQEDKGFLDRCAIQEMSNFGGLVLLSTKARADICYVVAKEMLEERNKVHKELFDNKEPGNE